MTMRATVAIGAAASLAVAGQAWAAPQAGGEPPSMNTPPPGPPPADQPLIQEIPRPHAYSIEGGAGLAELHVDVVAFFRKHFAESAKP